MRASLGVVKGELLCCCGRCCCQRRHRIEDGVDRLTLRFVDPQQEVGFANSHKENLSQYMGYIMATVVSVGVLNTVLAHRVWDDSQYHAQAAQELSRYQVIIHWLIVGSFVLVLGAARALASRDNIGVLGMEIVTVVACLCSMIVMVIIPKHYIARLWGHRDPEAVWGLELGSTDGNIVLYVDMCVTALHLLLPIRWLVLIPAEIAAVVAYTVPATWLGSPTMNLVPFNIIGLLALTALVAIGKRGFERQERRLFAGMLLEKQKRFRAEFEMSKVTGSIAAKPEDACSERSAPETTMTGRAFDDDCGNVSLDQIRSIGQREQWLIGHGEVQLLIGDVLGEGGYGIVMMGRYHNTLVAVKAPKEGVVKRGLINPCVPELCNELRILRRLRHPNIVFLYGACMDSSFHKLCLVLEFVDGMSLGAFIRSLPARVSQGGGPAREQALARSTLSRIRMILDIMGALRYLHSRQPVVVHGDLKDTNIFVEMMQDSFSNSTHRAKLLDFGLSRLVTRNARSLGGTVRWMAPELFSRQSVPPNIAADCYSFGQLLYFVTVGRMPFEGLRAADVMKRLRRRQPLSLVWPVAESGELSQVCRPVVDHCVQQLPTMRPSILQISEELSSLLDQASSAASELVPSARRDSPVLGVSLPGINGSPNVISNVAPDGSPQATLNSPENTAGGAAPVEFQGLVEVNQPNINASFCSLSKHDESGSLPPVQEHEVLDAGESRRSRRPGRSMARSCSKHVGFTGERQLAHPQFEPTSPSTRQLSLALLLLQWNYSMPANCCCWLHGSLLALEEVRREMNHRPCNRKEQGSMVTGQCSSCKLLLVDNQPSCEFCGDHTGEESASASATGQEPQSI